VSELDRDTALAIQLRAFRDWLEMLGGASDDARVVELNGGVAGAVVPRVPNRSITNSVIYSDGTALLDSLEELGRTYDEAGVNAWTVWAPDFDTPTIAALQAAGHSFDGRPAAMILDLADLGAPELGDLDWDADGKMEHFAAINDRAYGHVGDDGFAPGLARWPDGLPLRLYQAKVECEPVSVLGTIDHAPQPGAAGPDCGIYFVATEEEHRGRGLSTRLLLAALAEARERGCATSSLQASGMGEPVYERLGYRPYFRFQMYERRR
jgi:GNAT superfamily N-acetyltransferase